MALLIKRDCGFGSDYLNYVRISDIQFHIDFRQTSKPMYFWMIWMVCYFTKESRDIELLQKIDLDESTLSSNDLKKYREIKSRHIKPINEIKIEIVSNDFILPGVTDLPSLYRYFYNEIKTKHVSILGVNPGDTLDEFTERIMTWDSILKK